MKYMIMQIGINPVNLWAGAIVKDVRTSPNPDGRGCGGTFKAATGVRDPLYMHYQGTDKEISASYMILEPLEEEDD